LEQLVRRLGVSSSVHFAGGVPRSTMHRFLAEAAVVLATQDLSNLNNTVLEALVLGKPVVALDTGCTCQLIRHEETGLLYPPRDLEAAAHGIERILKDRRFAESLGKAGRRLALSVLKPWPERVRLEASIYRRFAAA